MDSYVVVGTVLAVVAGFVLMLRQPKPQEKQLANDMLRIGEQMKKYKQTAVETKTSDPLSGGGSSDAAAFPGGRVAIFFGSQTGTAEGFAEVLKKEGRKHGFDAHAIDLEEYKAGEFLKHEKLVIFVVATYGEGDPTDNAVDFIKLLKNKDGEIAQGDLADVGFTVFGLGNRQYEHYNVIGRLVDSQMEQLGAKRVFNYGEGDDDASLDEDFEEWKLTLWKELRKQYVPGASDEDDAAAAGDDAKEGTSAPEFEYECVEIRAPQTPRNHSETRMKTSTKHFFTAANAKVIMNRELRLSTVGGSTFHMEIDLKGTGIEYLTADNLAVLPENLPGNVDRLAKRLSYDLEQWVDIQPVGQDSKGELPFPSPCTIDQILTCYLSINSAPRKGPLKQLAYYARDPSERAQLLHLASKEGKDEYQQWVLDEERTYVDIFEHFQSIKLPVTALIHVVPFLAPRYYTISSSSLVNPQRIHATVTVVKNEKSDGRVFQGVCSTFMGDLVPLGSHNEAKKKRDSRPGEQGVKQPREWPTCRIFVRASTFRLPKNPQTPIIMIGPGTGIAPMRAFLQERAHQQANGVAVGQSFLYFGCRRRDEDFIYRDELEQFQTTGVLTELRLALSREQKEKVYVQHLLEKDGETVWNLLSTQSAHVYVCGATSMGNDVHKVLHKIIETYGSKSGDQAAAMLKDLQESQRYIQELWA